MTHHYSAMSNIRTLRDLEDSGPNTRPLPNPWASQGTYVEGVSYQPAPNYAAPIRTVDQFWSYNLEGQQPKIHHLVLEMCCCPCFVGPPCSDVRKRDYKKMLLSFSFWLTIIQIIYFIVELAVGGIAPISQNTVIGPPVSTLITLGGKFTPLIVGNYEVYRLIVPIFMHAGIFHLLFNMLIQFRFGLAFEKDWGSIRFIISYFVSGVAGCLLSAVALVNTVSVGASGAIMGIFGTKVSYVICKWAVFDPREKLYQLMNAGMLIVLTMLFSFNSSVDWAGHLGGLVVGFFLGFALFFNAIKTKWLKILTLIIGLLMTIAFYAVLFPILFTVIKV